MDQLNIIDSKWDVRIIHMTEKTGWEFSINDENSQTLLSIFDKIKSHGKISDDWYVEIRHGGRNLFVQNFYCLTVSTIRSIWPNFATSIMPVSCEWTVSSIYADEEDIFRKVIDPLSFLCERDKLKIIEQICIAITEKK